MVKKVVCSRCKQKLKKDEDLVKSVLNEDYLCPRCLELEMKLGKYSLYKSGLLTYKKPVNQQILIPNTQINEFKASYNDTMEYFGNADIINLKYSRYVCKNTSFLSGVLADDINIIKFICIHLELMGYIPNINTFTGAVTAICKLCDLNYSVYFGFVAQTGRINYRENILSSMFKSSVVSNSSWVEVQGHIVQYSASSRGSALHLIARNITEDEEFSLVV